MNNDVDNFGRNIPNILSFEKSTSVHDKDLIDTVPIECKQRRLLFYIPFTN